jgi:prophage regulatory protein
MSEIFNSSPALFRRRDIESITGLSRSTIYDLIKKGQFPKPIKLTARAVAWSRADVLAWVEKKLASAVPH